MYEKNVAGPALGQHNFALVTSTKKKGRGYCGTRPRWSSRFKSSWRPLVETESNMAVKYSHFEVCPIIRKGCAIDLVGQKIRLEDASAKTSGEIDELIKRDWVHIGLDKSERRNLRDGLSSYVKAGKKNEKKRTSCSLAHYEKLGNSTTGQVRYAALPPMQRNVLPQCHNSCQAGANRVEPYYCHPKAQQHHDHAPPKPPCQRSKWQVAAWQKPGLGRTRPEFWELQHGSHN